MKTVAAITPLNDDEWTDTLLTKDCGKIPFLLYKNHGMEVMMVGMSDNMDDYPSMKYIEGVKPVHIPDISIEKKVEYLKEHGKDIDVLILYGMYYTDYWMGLAYKIVNPNGKLLVNSDINSIWLRGLNLEEDMFRRFLDASDVIFATSSEMAKIATEKWHRKVHFITNGFYNFSNNKEEKSFDEKDNVILTVSRLGTKQKRTDILLESFAMIARFIPDWKLRLVGSVDESFDENKERFFNEHPDLFDRICFVGELTDKDELRQEYLNAKIFALPSEYEGGAPNVVGEALSAGCVMAVSRIDAWNDCIDDGRCGDVCEIGDVSGFAFVLRRLCTSPDLEAMSNRAKEYAGEVFDEEKNVQKLYDLLNESPIGG